MTRRIICVFLALLLCLSLGVSVAAAGNGTDFIVDEFGYLADSERESLNALAAALYDRYGVGFFFAYVQADSTEDFDAAPLVNGIADYVVMVENESHWCLHTGGAGAVLDIQAEDALRAVYDAEETYVGGVAEYLYALETYFVPVAAPAETTAAEIPYPEEEQLLYDEADLLTASEEAALVQKLTQISHDRNAQILVVTIGSMDGGDIDDFVDYLYDTMGFGYGENHDGVLLLVCMDPREYRILSNGYAGTAIGPDQIDTLCSFMETYLPGGHYATAFHAFADQSGEYLEYYQMGSPFPAGKNLAISLVIGLIAGLIVAFLLKGQLKSVRRQDRAQVYVKQGSMKLTRQQDIFLYRNVTRTKKQKREESTTSGSGDNARSKGGGSF